MTTAATAISFSKPQTRRGRPTTRGVAQTSTVATGRRRFHSRAAYAVSYNRPIITRGGGIAAGPQDFIFGVEYPAIRWLEQNGYDVSYMSGVDLDRLGTAYPNHKMFLASVMTSIGLVDSAPTWRRRGTRASTCLSGAETRSTGRRAGSPASARAATPIARLSLQGNQGRPHRSEQRVDRNLPGPAFCVSRRHSAQASGKCAHGNYVSGRLLSERCDHHPYDDANLRFWRNTSVANLQPGQSATLTQNYLGYEWDASPDNGFRPAGLIELSSTTLPVTEYLMDYGTRTGSATATHNLTLYRAPSGALVFSSGTVYWPWGLDPEA